MVAEGQWMVDVSRPSQGRFKVRLRGALTRDRTPWRQSRTVPVSQRTVWIDGSLAPPCARGLAWCGVNGDFETALTVPST